MAENNLKPCPFCGGPADVHKRRTACRFFAHSKKEIPANGTLTREIKYPDGTTIFEYIKAEYGAWCLDTRCIGRVGKVFPTKQDAITAWNRRATYDGV